MAIEITVVESAVLDGDGNDNGQRKLAATSRGAVSRSSGVGGNDHENGQWWQQQVVVIGGNGSNRWQQQIVASSIGK